MGHGVRRLPRAAQPVQHPVLQRLKVVVVQGEHPAREKVLGEYFSRDEVLGEHSSRDEVLGDYPARDEV